MTDRVRVPLVALLGLLAALLLLPWDAPAGPDLNCIGTDACTGNTGTIAEGACIGDESCRNNSGQIRKRACQTSLPGGGFPVCEGNAGVIGESSCQGSG